MSHIRFRHGDRVWMVVVTRTDFRLRSGIVSEIHAVPSVFWHDGAVNEQRPMPVHQDSLETSAVRAYGNAMELVGVNSARAPELMRWWNSLNATSVPSDDDALVPTE